VNVLSLFSGIGGLELGLERAGMSVVGQVELDPFCRSVLARHWPEVPRHDDIRTCVDWWWSEPRPPVHVVAGGPPCQPVSDAGLRLGADDERWRWPLMRDVIAYLRCRWVVFENVSGLHGRAYLGTACSVGAPHTRERLLVVAHPVGEGCRPRRADGGGAAPAGGEQPDRAEPPGGSWWADEPAVGRVAYGVPGRVDRIAALGNAVVPHLAERLGRRIVAADGLVGTCG